MIDNGTTHRGRARGQMTLDFTIGVTIFLIVLAGVFVFVPGTLQPFEEGGQEDLVTVNRVADGLAEQSLTGSTTPYILDANCTVAFFDTATSPSSECGYSGGNLSERVGVSGQQSINVTIRKGVDSGGGTSAPLCYNESQPPGERLNETDCGSEATRLAVGGTSIGDQSSVTARRVVELDGQDVFLVVVIW